MSTSGYGTVPSLTASQILSGMGVNQQNTYTIGNRNKMSLPGITFKLTQANGGTIVTVSEDRRQENMITLSEYQKEELYIIPDGVDDFDRELGKIITLHRMKQTHE
jgi:hypothetical protein